VLIGIGQRCGEIAQFGDLGRESATGALLFRATGQFLCPA
jgi:hypothetical protein